MEIGIEALTHLRNDALDLALLTTTYGPGALENVHFMRHTANKFSVIFRIIEARVNAVVDQVSKRTSYRIGGGVLDASVDTIDDHRLRKVTRKAFVYVVCYIILIDIDEDLRMRGRCAKEECYGAYSKEPSHFL